jgi:hypothetical protein
VELSWRQLGTASIFWFWKVWSWLGDDFQKDLAVFGWLYNQWLDFLDKIKNKHRETMVFTA